MDLDFLVFSENSRIQIFLCEISQFLNVSSDFLETLSKAKPSMFANQTDPPRHQFANSEPERWQRHQRPACPRLRRGGIENTKVQGGVGTTRDASEINPPPSATRKHRGSHLPSSLLCELYDTAHENKNFQLCLIFSKGEGRVSE